MAGNLQDARAGTRQADRNRERRQAAKEQFIKLLELASQPGFCGTVAVEVSAKDGALGKPKYTQVQYADLQD